jgi:concentrative nucleoside transporter, CNT family
MRATDMKLTDPPASMFEAIVRGAMDGVTILAGVVAMLIVLVALVHLADSALSLLPNVWGHPISLRGAFALVFRPLVWLIGVPWEETGAAATLMATKTVLNEFVAYLDLSKLPAETLSPHSRLIMTYALCGFANFGSLGIMIGGMTTMAPERRHDIVALAPRSLISGTLATLMSGAVVGMM